MDKPPCSFEGWIFAARHRLFRLEQYQREDVNNRNLIEYIFKEDDGLKLMLDQGLSVEVVSPVMASVAREQWMEKHLGVPCCRCKHFRGQKSPCSSCRDKLLKDMRSGFKI